MNHRSASLVQRGGTRLAVGTGTPPTLDADPRFDSGIDIGHIVEGWHVVEFAARR